MNESKATRDRSLKNCACRNFWAEESLGDGSDSRIYGTGCLRQTNNLFAQGHDAKLVSFLVKAELTGDDIRWNNSGVDHLFTEATAAAAVISGSLAAKAERAVRNALDKLAASGKLQNGKGKGAIKPEAKAPRPVGVRLSQAELSEVGRQVTEQLAELRAEKSAAVATTVRGKVGRWEYNGTIDEDGAFWYETKAGTQTAAAGKWTKVQ